MSAPIRFDDGAAYERMMGTWSRIAGATFLDWLDAPPRLRWLDVGCGNGSFTQLLLQRCAPAHVTGIDPSAAQLAFARTRPDTPGVQYLQGDAMALPFQDASFDAAVMALVLFFVPDPARGAAEMLRVVRPGGLLCAYLWDVPGGGLPHEPLREAMREMGLQAVLPPAAPVAELGRLAETASGAGWQDVETTAYGVQRTFDGFEDLWATSILGSTLRDQVEKLDAHAREELRSRVQARCTPDADGRITWHARVNAVKAWRKR